MELVFVTNYYNHHQAALAKCFDVQTGHHFYFIETEPISSERKSMGWSNEDAPAYVKKAYGNEQIRLECQQLINAADVVIWGSCPFSMIQPRLKARKLTFCYSERLFKRGFGIIAFGGRAIKHWMRQWCYQKNHYLLCASAYAAEDYAKIGLFRNQAYKWGYFPESKYHEAVDDIIAKKQSGTILWAGRMIDWKHPEIPVRVAKKLKDNGFRFQLDMIGNGDQMPIIEELIKELELEDYIHLLGAKSPDEVREYMEKSDIYLFTSDQNEGWGAVVNEAMSSACAVVACEAAGSVRYLIKNGENGTTYHFEQLDEMYYQVEDLLKDRGLCHQYGRQAYDTMKSEWSAHNAAKRFIELVLILTEGRQNKLLQGPCSKA